MIFEQLAIGGDRNYAYLIADESSLHAAIVDPGTNPGMILDAVKNHGLTVKYILNTHSHFDHIGANQVIARETGAPILGFNPGTSNKTVADGDEIALGDLVLKILYTPGHTPDCICILMEDKICTGDTLFVGKVGGTGYGEDARQEYDSLHKKIMVLPDDIEVYPGHNYGTAPTSTIGNERKTNPFIIQPDFEAFVDLKQNWPAYKLKHGIS